MGMVIEYFRKYAISYVLQIGGIILLLLGIGTDMERLGLFLFITGIIYGVYRAKMGGTT